MSRSPSSVRRASLTQRGLRLVETVFEIARERGVDQFELAASMTQRGRECWRDAERRLSAPVFGQKSTQ